MKPNNLKRFNTFHNYSNQLELQERTRTQLRQSRKAVKPLRPTETDLQQLSHITSLLKQRSSNLDRITHLCRCLVGERGVKGKERFTFLFYQICLFFLEIFRFQTLY